ncbi:MAG: hypothetical protein NC131_10655 [Roseburia sp.]|nr:hypothetical protein [Roseburia sp.]
MTKVKIHIPIVIIFCLFIYPVIFKFSSIVSYIYIYGVPVVYLLFNWRLIKRITKKQLVIIILAMLLILLGCVYPILHRTHDYSYVKITFYIFRKLIIYLFLGCILVKKYKEKASFEHFIFYYSIVHAIYVIGTIILVFVPNLKQIWFSIFMGQDRLEQMQASYGYTFRVGWQGFSGYRLTLHCTFCCIFLLYLYFVGGKTLRLNFKQFIVTYMLCLLGNMFYGRSGLVVSIVVSIIGIFVWNIKHIHKLLLFICVLGISLLFIYSLRDITQFSDWYRWMSNPVINFFKYGSFKSASFNSLKQMVFMPKWETILFGDGYFTLNGLYYMETDSGIMRNILFWGIIGMIISYGMTIYSIWDLKRKNWLLCILMLFTFAVFEYKGDVYYEFVALLLSASFIESMRNRKYAKLTPILSKKYV